MDCAEISFEEEDTPNQENSDNSDDKDSFNYSTEKRQYLKCLACAFKK